MQIIRCKNNFGEDVELPLDRFRYRPSVYAVLKNGNCLLVCKTKSNGKLWFAGGGVEKNETHEEALRREVVEEAGIENFNIKGLIADFRNYCYYAPEDDACDAHLFFYECETNQETFKSNDEIEDGEAVDFQWMKVETVLKKEFCDANDRIQKMLSDFYKI